mmetsp:Transcript_2880/g.9024  ORF Transcript_2880/g.9024 Transcript_2880/m.9024 type:complete len:137 (-) Transcript_2880:648-1058(-)
MLQCLQPVWTKVFSSSNNELAWAESGLFPFTQRPYWLQKAKEERPLSHKALAAKVPQPTDQINSSQLRAPCTAVNEGDDVSSEGACGARSTSADLRAIGDPASFEERFTAFVSKIEVSQVKKADAKTLREACSNLA